MTSPPLRDGSDRTRSLLAFALLTWAGVAVHALVFLAEVAFVNAAGAAFAVLVHVTYSAFYTIAGLLPVLVVHGVLSAVPNGGRAARFAVPAAAVFGTAALHFTMLADGIVHRRYGFHLNGMIWNLVTTPGGIDSLGADLATKLTVAALAVGFGVAQWGLWRLAGRWDRAQGLASRLTSWRRLAAAVGVLVVLHGADRLCYGYAYKQSYKPVTGAASAYPFYVRSRMSSRGDAAGTWADRTDHEHEHLGLHYPLKPLVRRPGSPTPNVVWLVAESLRADRLTEEIMPATWRFAQGGRFFRNHRSAGNGTRMGMFGMFYGLYGAYWDTFLGATRSPVVMDVLQDAGYDVRCSTSARFTFPEFDRTLFAKVPADRMSEGDPEKLGWQNDELQVTRLLESIGPSRPAGPFFRFMFFESPHAPYHFPRKAAIRDDALDSVNYVTLDVDDPEEMRRLLNRYTNACRHLDMQLERIYEHLASSGLLDSTIVLVTGDHGEEFMEKGRYGHHSAFTEEQVRSPLVIRGPGVTPGEVLEVSSHLDVPATLLTLLGVENPPSDYSLGFDLLGGGRRSPIVLSDWDNLCLVTGGRKIVLPYRGNEVGGDLVRTEDDGVAADADEVMGRHTADVARIIEELSRFRR